MAKSLTQIVLAEWHVLVNSEASERRVGLAIWRNNHSNDWCGSVGGPKQPLTHILSHHARRSRTQGSENLIGSLILDVSYRGVGLECRMRVVPANHLQPHGIELGTSHRLGFRVHFHLYSPW